MLGPHSPTAEKQRGHVGREVGRSRGSLNTRAYIPNDGRSVTMRAEGSAEGLFRSNTDSKRDHEGSRVGRYRGCRAMRALKADE